MRNMIKNILKDGSHEISEASNYDEAIKAYQEKKPDMVFLDIVMPGKSGVETLKDIKQFDQNAKVVMCTSIGGQQKIIDDAVAAGASDFVIKPFKPEDILKAVQNLGQSQ
jgi:two-component system chemotaxis response regulator CheY